MIRKLGIGLGVLALAAALWIWHAGGFAAHKAVSIADLAVPVAVASVQRQDVPIYLNGIGTVQAYNSVAVKSRVDGELQSLDFREGQEVKSGQILARIDPRPYQATLAQNQAALQKDRAQLANAKLDFQRFQSLIGKGFASRQSLDTQQAMVQQYEAQLAADQATIDYARTQLNYCTIVSPISGRTGIRQVDPGNIIHAADTTPIVTVTQIQPISVVFTLPAADLDVIAPAQAKSSLVVFATGKDNQRVLSQGRLELFDNQIDQTTGTIKLKATFQNADVKLWPGQFVNARLLVDTRHDGLTVPTSAVQLGPQGHYVWVVTADGKAAIQDVQVLQTFDGKSLIGNGVTPGDRIIIDGQYLLQPGSKIVIQRQAPATGAAGAPGGDLSAGPS